MDAGGEGGEGGEGVDGGSEDVKEKVESKLDEPLQVSL